MEGNLFLIAEPRDDLSLFEFFRMRDFLSVLDGSLSLVFEIDFHKNVFPTSSEKLITPVAGLI